MPMAWVQEGSTTLQRNVEFRSSALRVGQNEKAVVVEAEFELL